METLTNAKEIRDTAMEKLERVQFEIGSVQHTLQTAYFDLRRLQGTEEADRYVDSLQALPW